MEKVEGVDPIERCRRQLRNGLLRIVHMTNLDLFVSSTLAEHISGVVLSGNAISNPFDGSLHGLFTLGFSNQRHQTGLINFRIKRLCN